ncbi:conjugal transfer protein TraF [Nostoc sp. CHAB 5834]|nr:conjugal transfer protein TraF [Nostoc sp. CHAB 5834]
MSKLYLGLISLMLALPVFAQEPAPAKPAPASSLSSSTGEVEAGWFFFKDPPKPVTEEEPTPTPTPKPQPGQKPPPPKEDKCAKKSTWSVECGFINPGTDFEFQEKQRDALMQRMALANNDPKAVENFQYYMRWVLERTTEVTNNWWYNMVQNPDLDPSVKEPISAFGLRLMTDVQKGHADEIFKLIKSEGGFLIYFSRSDCIFCHQMGDTLHRLAEDTGLEIRNASLDDKCMPGFEKGCMKSPDSLAPAQALQVSVVPSVFLYVPPKTWLRIATGVVDVTTLKTRAAQFFSAYRNALLNGVENGTDTKPSVDFAGTAPTGTSVGIPKDSNNSKPSLPDELDIKKMLGAAGG